MKLVLTFLLIPVLVFFVACTQSVDDVADNGDTTDNGTVASTLSAAEIVAARQVVYDYWEAFNAYDAEGALASLEESYRQERAEEIPDEIGQMEAAGVTLGVEEEAEPTVTPEGTVVMKIKLDVPILPDRQVTYELVKIDGEWKICYSEEE